MSHAKTTDRAVVMPDATSGRISIRVCNEGLREYIEIKNRSTIAQPMTGWVLASLRGCQVIECPGIVLTPGASIRIHSGCDPFQAPPGDWLSTTDKFRHNGFDVAVLFDAVRREVTRHAYPAGLHAGDRLTKPMALVRVDGQSRIIALAPLEGSSPETLPKHGVVRTNSLGRAR